MTSRTARRLAWGSFTCTAALLALGIALHVTGVAAREDATEPIFDVVLLVFAGVGAVVAARRPGNAIGWIFLGVGTTSVLLGTVGSILARAGGDPDSLGARLNAWTDAWFWVPFVFVPTVFPLLLFPDGHPPSPRWRWLVWTAGIGIVAFSLAMAFDPSNYPSGAIPIGVRPPAPLIAALSFAGFALIVGLVGGIAAVVVRSRRAQGDERQQIRWLRSAGLFAGACLIGSFVSGAILTTLGMASEAGGTLTDQILNGIVLIGVLALPVGMGIAILKNQLYGIDVVIRKTVIYAILVGLLLAMAGVVIAVLGAILVEPIADAPVALIGSGLVIGVAIWPLRRVATLTADRVVFGGRKSPYEVMAEFSGRIGETYSAEDVLTRMAQIIATGVGAGSVIVWLRVGDEFQPASSWPPDAAAPSLPPSDATRVRHQGEVLGAISVSMPANDPMTDAKRALVRDLAAQAGPVLRNVRLIEELRESRRRIVAAQDERAKKLERNIHDGAQQQLVALAVKLRLLEQVAGRDPERASALATELQGQANEALEDLRDLARGIYPPLLADKGLEAALEAQARKGTTTTTIQADGIGRLPQEVEAAVYFSVLECLNNIAKYAQASHSDIAVSRSNGRLWFEVRDDGRGFDPTETAYGTGLQGMADRLSAVGGDVKVTSTPGEGTVVRGSLPLSTSDLGLDEGATR